MISRLYALTLGLGPKFIGEIVEKQDFSRHYERKTVIQGYILRFFVTLSTLG